ncbi:LicD family protein [Butyrivibrio sp. NC3005]|uniref:LicD family protein n=1 Tax=Butyrivibrio sp. NC3005 TaxID=1280685 RepID=UPI0003FB2339|nr:LicD family protein [Butyrivibrio sp. NC3005]
MKKSLLSVDDSFFRDEEIDGFLVPEKMKRFWMCGLEVLERFNIICRELGISYFACWGTLLGAIRHGNYIPWDDDIDIIMKRRDYNILVDFYNKNGFMDDMVLLNRLVVGNYENLTARVINATSYSTQADRLMMYHGCPYVNGLDIDVLDKKNPNKDDDDLQMTLIDKVLEAAVVFKAYEEESVDENGKTVEEKDVKEMIELVEQTCGITVNRNESLYVQMSRLENQLAQIYEDIDTDTLHIVSIRSALDRNAAQFKSSLFDDNIWVPFGPTKISVPIGYQEILTRQYGSDYLTPHNRKGAHDYPLYKKQDEELDKLGVAHG